MFLGEFRYTIDDKGRLTIPARYRPLLGESVVITRGFDRNLIAFSLDGWKEYTDRIKNLPLTDPNAREFRRRMFSGAADVVPDKQGRILLPPFLREFANITDEVVISGNYNHFEIWNADAWQPVRESMEDEPGTAWEDLGI
jgi:MraZ protein